MRWPWTRRVDPLVEADAAEIVDTIFRFGAEAGTMQLRVLALVRGRRHMDRVMNRALRLAKRHSP